MENYVVIIPGVLFARAVLMPGYGRDFDAGSLARPADRSPGAVTIASPCAAVPPVLEAITIEGKRDLLGVMHAWIQVPRARGMKWLAYAGIRQFDASQCRADVNIIVQFMQDHAASLITEPERRHQRIKDY